MSETSHLIGLLLGTEEDWPRAFETLLERVGPVRDADGTTHRVTSERITIEPLGQGFFRVQASYGFMETPNVPAVLHFCGRHGINAKKTDVSYYLGRERLLPNLPRR